MKNKKISPQLKRSRALKEEGWSKITILVPKGFKDVLVKYKADSNIISNFEVLAKAIGFEKDG